ncbi:hypothetical protein GFV_13g0040 [Bracoviriform facetosae]|uniref:Uncharacterized protein n=1 Tax=Bracoviriform facetosae TaxID=2083300 RepID=B8PQ64_9VIRU|nr:hypothetical protein GFV_13g0040 [Bracoviriform facetosae]ACE75490.1 hypothetical protein GFV_13g0040 [Bracoviriform facetosae]
MSCYVCKNRYVLPFVRLAKPLVFYRSDWVFFVFRATTHKNIYVVPRTWLAFDNFECALWKIHADHYRQYGNTKGFKVEINGVSAHMENYRDHLWLKKENDFTEKPDPKKYSSAFVTCIHCNKI